MKISTLLKVFVHISCVFGILLIAWLPKNKYEWMLQMDPTLRALPNDETAGARLIITVLTLAYVLGVQLFFFARASTIWQKLPSLILACVVTGVWLAKWH